MYFLQQLTLCAWLWVALSCNNVKLQQRSTSAPLHLSECLLNGVACPQTVEKFVGRKPRYLFNVSTYLACQSAATPLLRYKARELKRMPKIFHLNNLCRISQQSGMSKLLECCSFKEFFSMSVIAAKSLEGIQKQELKRLHKRTHQFNNMYVYVCVCT